MGASLIALLIWREGKKSIKKVLAYQEFLRQRNKSVEGSGWRVVNMARSLKARDDRSLHQDGCQCCAPMQVRCTSFNSDRKRQYD
jgi:hypothetical protein